MPSVSKRQRGFMAKAANDPAFAKARGIPQTVAKEFRTADLKKMRKKHQIHHLNARTHAD